MTIELTAREADVLAAFIEEGRDCNGAECAQDLIDDNMTWMDADDLQAALGWDKQTIGGLMSSLEAKGLISDSAEPLPGRKINAWTATDEGILQGFPLTEYPAT